MDFSLLQRRYALSNQDLARIVGCSRSTVQKWRAGTVPVPIPIGRFLRLLDHMARGSRVEFERLVRLSAADVPVIFFDQPEERGAIDVCRTLQATVKKLEEYLMNANGLQDKTMEDMRYKQILQNIPDAVCRWLPDTTLTFVNRAYCQCFGMEDTGLLGKRWIEFVPEKERNSILKYLESMLSGSSRPLSYKHHAFDRDNRLIIHEWTDIPILDAEGKAQEFYSIGRPVNPSHADFTDGLMTDDDGLVTDDTPVGHPCS